MASPWEALLQPNAPITDTSDNPEYDDAMGIQSSGGSDLQNGIGKVQSIMSRASPEGRGLTMEIAKQKMASQVALQLYQAKLQLERQYPTYSSHPTPWGSVLMVPSNGDASAVKEVGLGDGTAKNTYMAQERARAADADADVAIKTDPNYAKNQLAEQQSKLDLTRAQTDQAKANTSYIQGAKTSAEAARASSAGQGKDWGTADDERVIKMTNQKYGIPPSDPFGIWDATHVGVREKASKEAADIIEAGRGTSNRGRVLNAASGATAPVAADASQAPDVGSMLDLSNGLGNKGLMDQ